MFDSRRAKLAESIAPAVQAVASAARSVLVVGVIACLALALSIIALVSGRNHA